MLDARELCSIEERMIRSMPILASIVSVTAMAPTIPTSSGAMKSGLRAMSAKVSPGEINTPMKRSKNDLGGSAFSTGVATAGLPINQPPQEFFWPDGKSPAAPDLTVGQDSRQSGTKQGYQSQILSKDTKGLPWPGRIAFEPEIDC